MGRGLWAVGCGGSCGRRFCGFVVLGFGFLLSFLRSFRSFVRSFVFVLRLRLTDADVLYLPLPHSPTLSSFCTLTRVDYFEYGLEFSSDAHSDSQISDFRFLISIALFPCLASSRFLFYFYEARVFS